jgi:cytochrome c553
MCVARIIQDRGHGGTMKKVLAGVILALLPAFATAADQQLALPQPDWAYPEQDPAFPRDPADNTPKTVPGSSRQLTRAQVGGFFGGIEDWFPERHGPMPDVVKNGRQPGVRACAACHLTSGQGHPSAGMSAGMSVEYFTRQVHELAAGQRNPRSAGMMNVAKAMNEDEIKAAAEYFHRQKPQKWVRVVEADTVPVTWVGTGDFRQIKPNAGTEPIGNRIIEIPEDIARTNLRDPYSGYIAYAPPGSIARGQAIVTTGGGKTVPCGICHGPDLKGLGDVPAIAGRLPSYLTRMLIDFRNRTRNGTQAPLMQGVVDKLTVDDIVNIVAYVSSRDPS